MYNTAAQDNVLNIVVLGNCEESQSSLVDTFGYKGSGMYEAVHGDVVKKRLWIQRLGIRVTYFVWRLVDPNSHYFETADAFIFLLDPDKDFTSSSFCKVCDLARSKNKSGKIFLVQLSLQDQHTPRKIRSVLSELSKSHGLRPPRHLSSVTDVASVGELFEEVAAQCVDKTVPDPGRHQQVRIRSTTNSGSACMIM